MGKLGGKEAAVMRLKASGILIDLDGTLVDSRAAYIEAARRAFKTINLDGFDEKKALEIPKRLEQGIPLTEYMPETQVKQFLGVYLKAYYELTEKLTRPFPNVHDTLEKLSAKAKLALLTMRFVPAEKVKSELEKFGMAKYFCCILTALNTPLPKPFPEGLLKCAELLDVRIEECIVVGDSVADIKAGKRSGAKTIAVLSGLYSREELEREKPDLILRSINELPSFIE
ncbi:HAD family hydrolase [Candidatus Bathyarchaeota archaeon]|nr:HAD family hydrolase [Candidatus Bathyarchaeota archaeon]